MITDEERREYRKRKEKKSLKGAEELSSRDIRCPGCGHKILIAFDDCVGHITVYCTRCHSYQMIDFKLFRLEKKRRLF